MDDTRTRHLDGLEASKANRVFCNLSGPVCEYNGGGAMNAPPEMIKLIPAESE
jgi:hypothetical protein